MKIFEPQETRFSYKIVSFINYETGRKTTWNASSIKRVLYEISDEMGNNYIDIRYHVVLDQFEVIIHPINKENPLPVLRQKMMLKFLQTCTEGIEII